MKRYRYVYKSLIGDLEIISDGKYITGIKLLKEKEEIKNKELKIFKDVIKWLDEYFRGIEPKTKVKIKLEGTPFQKEVWHILKEIPYSKTITYGTIAHIIAQKKGIKKMSAQAVGNAINKNPLLLIIPCHRVLGKDNLGGFALGLEIKKILLKLEGII